MNTQSTQAWTGGIKRTLAITLAAGATLMAATSFAAADEHVRLKYDNCTASQQLQISKAMVLASEALDEVMVRLDVQKMALQDDAVVDRWFGARASGELVAGKLGHIADRLDFDAPAIVVECDITNRDTFAWTYTAMEGVGYLGFGVPFFDAAAVGGFDSRMGTIIHELAHMVPAIAADDHSYSIHQMEEYARDNPKIAFDNAQNYEYLVEQLYDAILTGPISSFIGV